MKMRKTHTKLLRFVHRILIATASILLISAYCHLLAIPQPAYALYTFSGPKHYIENCSLPCDYIVTANNYNFTIQYWIRQGNNDLPPEYYIMNVTSISIDTFHKTLNVNTTGSLRAGGLDPTTATLQLVVPKNLLDAPAGSGNFIAYADGKRVTNNGCDTGDKKPAVCVYDDTATPESNPMFSSSFTTFTILVNEPGKHSISIIGTQVTPELPFSNAILATIAGFLGIIVVLTRARFTTFFNQGPK